MFAGGASEPTLGQRERLGFGSKAAAGIGWTREAQRYALGLTVSAEDDGDGLRLDHSFAEVHAGGFAFGVGAVARNWSPSRLTSLILSRNARPMPSVYVRKEEFTHFGPAWLDWAGEWNGEIFVSKADDSDLLGMRLQLRPVEGFDIDLVRLAQYGAGGTNLGDALSGDTNEGPGADVNQLAGVGLSWALPTLPLRVYVQGIGEDEAGGLPSCFMYLGGVEGTGHMFGLPTTVTVEGATTEIDGDRYCGPGTAYNNAAYPDGLTYKGDVLGLPLDTDSRMVQIAVDHELPQMDLHWGLGWHEINVTGRADHRLSAEAVEGAVARVGASRSWDGLTVGGDVTWQSYDLDRAGIDRGMGVALHVSRTF